MGDKGNTYPVSNFNDDEIEQKLQKGLGEEIDYAVDVEEGAECLREVHCRVDQRTKRICVIAPACWCWDADGLQNVAAQIKTILLNPATQKNTDESYEQLQKELQEIEATRWELNGKKYGNKNKKGKNKEDVNEKET